MSLESLNSSIKKPRKKQKKLKRKQVAKLPTATMVGTTHSVFAIKELVEQESEENLTEMSNLLNVSNSLDSLSRS